MSAQPQRLLLLALAALLVLLVFRQALLASIRHAAPHGAAQLHAPLRERDLGHVISGTALTTHFPLYNRGQRRLVLNVWNESCNCSPGETDSLVILPGEQADWTLQQVLSQPPGPFIIRAELTTNDPTAPKLTLIARGQVIAAPAIPSPPATGQPAER